MEDFRLKVFLTAAKTLSFTRCAEQLFISQPAVSKNISELEKHFRTRLFHRRGSGLELTESGRLLEKWSEKITSMYITLENEMAQMGKVNQGELRLGASTTIAQYVIPPVIAGFNGCYPDIRVSMITGNSERIEQALFAKEIELGFVENVSRRGGLQYRHFADDRLVAVARSGADIPTRIKVSELQTIPLVLREKGSGTLELVTRRLASLGVSLQSLDVVAWLDSSEAIKAYLSASDAMAIISVAAVRKELGSGSLKPIDIEGLDFTREFSRVSCQGEHDALSELFCQFAQNFML